VLVASAVLALTGVGFVAGAGYLALARGVGWVPLAAGLVLGPLTVYVAVHLLRGTHWAWLAVVLLLLLLLASSIWRLTAAEALDTVPIVEIAFEILGLGYLTRRPVRQSFARR